MDTALDVVNDVMAEISSLISDDLINDCGFNSLKELMIDAITNKTSTGKHITHLFIARFRDANAALAAIQSFRC